MKLPPPTVLCLAAMLTPAFSQDGNVGTPPPGPVTPSRHIAATSSIHDPRTSYTHLPVMSGRPVNDTPIIMCTWSGCDILTWLFPEASLTVALSPIENGGDPPQEDSGPVPPPRLSGSCWSLYDLCGQEDYNDWLIDSVNFLGLDPSQSLLGADPDGDGQVTASERNLHMHPFDSRAGFEAQPFWMITPTEPRTFTMEFAGLSGHVYSLEWSADFVNWQPVRGPFRTPETHDSASDIGPNRYFVYYYTVNLPPELAAGGRYFFRMSKPEDQGTAAATAGSGNGAAIGQPALIPFSDEHPAPGSALQPTRRLIGRFWNPRPGTPVAITFNENYIRNPGPLDYKPVQLPPSFDLNDPLRVLQVVFSHLPANPVIYPSENYYYWSLRIGDRHIRGNINLSVRDRDRGVLSFYYGEIVDVVVNGSARRYHLAGGHRFEAPTVQITRSADNTSVYDVRLGNRTVPFTLFQPRQSPLPVSVLRNTEKFVERIMDESGLQFVLVFQPAGNGRPTGTFVWLLDSGPWEAPFPRPVPADFVAVAGTSSAWRHVRTGFVFQTETADPSLARRYVLIGVQEEHVARNTWFDGPGDQLADNFASADPIKELMLQALPGIDAADIDEFGYFTESRGTERIGLYVYRGYRTDADIATFVNTVTPAGTPDADTAALWAATMAATTPNVAPAPLRFAFNAGGLPALPQGVVLTGAERNQTTGQLTIQTSEAHATPLLPRVWMTKTQKGTVVSLDTPSGGVAARVVGEYRTAPQAVNFIPPPALPWKDDFSPGPTAVAVDAFGECWVANTGDNRIINGVTMGSIVRIGVVTGGTRCLANGTPNAAGEYLKPPFQYVSPSVRDRDGDGLLRTANGLSNPLPWPGTADVARLDGMVTTAHDELITAYVRTHATGVSTLAARDLILWAGGDRNKTVEPVSILTGRVLFRPWTLTGAQTLVPDYQNLLWTLEDGRVSRYSIGNTNVPTFAETLAAGLGPAASHAGAAAMVRGNRNGGRLWLGSNHPGIVNEVSLHTAQPGAFTRLPLVDPANPAIHSAGVIALTEMSKATVTTFGPVFATETSLPVFPGPLVESPAAGSFWIARNQNGPVVRHEVPRNADIPAPFNRGLAGCSQGRGQTMWFADFLGHRAVQTNISGGILQTVNLYTPAELTSAQQDAAASDTIDPLHLLAGPWTVGDMTGMNRTTPGNTGLITIARDAGIPGHSWSRIAWTGTGLSAATIRVFARAGDTALDQRSPFREVASNVSLTARGFDGRHLQILIQLREPLIATTIAPALSTVTAE